MVALGRGLKAESIHGNGCLFLIIMSFRPSGPLGSLVFLFNKVPTGEEDGWIKPAAGDSDKYFSIFCFSGRDVIQFLREKSCAGSKSIARSYGWWGRDRAQGYGKLWNQLPTLSHGQKLTDRLSSLDRMVKNLSHLLGESLKIEMETLISGRGGQCPSCCSAQEKAGHKHNVCDIAGMKSGCNHGNEGCWPRWRRNWNSNVSKLLFKSLMLLDNCCNESSTLTKVASCCPINTLWEDNACLTLERNSTSGNRRQIWKHKAHQLGKNLRKNKLEFRKKCLLQ